MFQPPSFRETAEAAKARGLITDCYLNKQVLITVSDHRCFQGEFVCVDHECNVILQGAHEYQPSKEKGVGGGEEGKRWCGMVMIPGKHLVEIRVKENGNGKAYSMYM